MRFILHIRVCALLAVGSVCSLSYGQTGTAIFQSVPPEQRPFSAFCVPSKIAAPDFQLWSKPQEHIFGLNMSADCLPQVPQKIQMHPSLLEFEESLCPKDCRICGVIYDKGTPIHFCTKG
jgi:hypothetical protein